MSRLDELIQELCPDGVEHTTLGKVAKIETGKLNANAAVENGKYMFFTTAKEPSKIDSFRWDTEALLVAGNANVGDVKHYIGKFEAYQRTYVLTEFREDLLVKFIYYVLANSLKEYLNSYKNEAAMTYIVLGTLTNFEVPVPPLEVQREIVRILDSFTLLTAELTAELTTELTARKSQYEFYRCNLLNYDTSIAHIPLKELAQFTYGYTDTAKDIGDTRYIRITDINEDGTLKDSDAKYITLGEDSKKYVLHKGDLLLARTGASYGKTLYYPNEEQAVYASFLIKITLDNSRILNRYYWHFSKSQLYWSQAEKLVSKGGQQQFNTNAVNRVVVPVPSLEIQRKVIEVLDSFEALCSDLNIGLPAEIEARQKQYEFYRDALLTYAATGKIIAQTDEHNALIKLCQYVFGVVFVNLSDIATITRGGNFQKKDFTDTGVPCIHYGQMYTHFGIYATETLKFISEKVAKKSKMAVKNDIVMAVTSENVEDVCKCTAWLGNEDIAVSGHTAIIHHNQNAKYLSYYFHSDMFFTQKKRLAHGTKVIEVTPNALNDIVIPLPSLEEQERIVGILDRFDALCNDISSGLPAEIEARQKQYEYYRDRLLNFEPITK